MSDRWKDELKKLRGVEPPENLWDRAQRSPSADRLPPRRERIVAGVVAMSVFVAAGAFAFQALRPAAPSAIVGTTGEPIVTIDLTKDDTGTSAVLGFEGLQQEGLPGDAILSEDGSPGFVWDGSLAVTDFVQVPSGAVLEYSGNAPEATATFLVWPSSSDGGAQVVVEGDLDLPADPGRYTLGVLGSWSDGEPFVFVFGIEIVQSEHSAPTPSQNDAVDPTTLPCEGEDGGHFLAGPRAVNPMPDAIPRMVSAIRSTDRVEAAGHPIYPGSRYRVIRDGAAVAIIDVPDHPLSESLDMWIAKVVACPASGVGDEHESTQGPLANGLEVPDFRLCDLYLEPCVSVFVSDARYAELRGEPIPTSDPRYPVCPEDDPNNEVCSPDPDTNPEELFMTPDDATSFVTLYGCGATKDDFCRMVGVVPGENA